MPFDVNTFAFNSTLATFMVELTSTAPPTQPISAPTASTTTQAIHQSAVAADAELDSPLGLMNDTPLSQLLASPLFSDTASTVDYSNSATPFESPASFFPPLESIVPSGLLSHRSSFEEKPAPASSSTSSPAPVVGAVPHKKIALDAPVQRRNYAVPSSTSRKRKTIAVERAIAKRAREEGAADVDAVVQSVDDDHVPDDLVAAVERKRLQNTMSARRARQRKAEHMAQLESENARLKEENDELRRRLAAYE